MLEYSLRHHRDANFAVSQYFNVALQQHNTAQQLLRQLFPADWSARSVLDFACGYGRHLRFLTLALPPSHVWASEIQRDAVEFVVRVFGVHGLQSVPEPAQFEPWRRFDFIWVASLFSHLPPRLFHAWLEKLVGLLTADGILCFSVHDASEQPLGEAMPQAGIRFISESENAELDTASYGTTFVEEGFVREAIDRACIAGHAWLRIPRALASHQDLYLVSARSSNRLPSLVIRKGPWGWVDIINVSPAGDLYIAGWAGSLDSGSIGRVEIRLDDDVHYCPTTVLREDVRRVVGDDRCGFEFEAKLNGLSEVFLEVSAGDGPAEAALIYAGALRVP